MEVEFMDINSNNNDNNEVNSSISSDLIRGHINTIILRTLYDGDKYGYEIINEIEDKSKGQYTLKQPTLYSALKRLESQDYVTSYWGGVSNGGRRKYFQLTEKGRAIVQQNLAEWEYSRSVIDSLISERPFDFSNPAPTGSVDFNLLKKSTTRVRTGKDDDNFDYDEQNEEENAEVSAPQTDTTSESANSEQVSESHTYDNQTNSEQHSDYVSYTSNTHVETLHDENEQQRIHENYKRLVGEESDTTSYYYSNLNQQQHFDEKNQEESANQYDTRENDAKPDSIYTENNAIASDLLYSNKSPAERNYKQLLSKLYDNTHQNVQQIDYNENEQPSEQVYEEQHPTQQPTQQPVYEQTVRQYAYNNAKPASNIEFYDIEEKAENDGLKVTTANKSHAKPEIKSIGNTYDKGKALFSTALYVFVIALIESIVILCLKGALRLSAGYVIVPFIISFLTLGIFMFLYLKGYGKNSRKSQAKSFISASLIIYVNVVLVICLIAYIVMFNAEIIISFGQICKYAIFPCIFAFNIPLFAIFYNYNRNKK